MSEILKPDEFVAFFEAVHGVEPFPWQKRLAKQVFRHDWPMSGGAEISVLDVPTGAGKTSAIDIAIFHLALEADQKSKRRAPVRILFVVDRRLIVDDAYQRARKIAEKLAKPDKEILNRVAARLAILAEANQPPLAVGRLRGGAPKEPDWVRTPAQPMILVSTVDQVGSRMLFRGYGVSDSMKPLHAGLLGSDALLLLDEAHLSEAFVQTSRDARAFQNKEPWSENKSPAPFKIVKLSATQTDEAVLVRDDNDKLGPLVRDDDLSHPVLGLRLKTSKKTELIKCEANADDAAFTQEFVDAAWKLSKAGEGNMTVVAVVVNRVNRARHIFDEIERRGARPFQEYGQDDAEDGSSEVALLIGRARAMDRDRLTIALLPRIRAGRNRDEFKRPLFIVATQCVEAGADLDFDALVTELAPLDSLRQRFGRLNRLGHIDKNQDGERGELQSDQSRAVILAANDQAAKKVKPDPIYGEASKNTWDWLCARCHTQGKGKKASYVIDFGVVASEKWIPRNKELENCIAPRLNAPVLLPRDLTLWTMTSPIPAVDSEVSLYLHGPKTGPGDVEVVWRADIDEGMSAVEWKDRLRVCPPSALEALAVPFSEAKRWLRREASADIPDVEAGEGEEDERGRKEARMVLRWRGPDDERTELISGRRISPGDVIVVPSAWGGCDRWGWAPWKEEEVEDIGEDANEQGRGRVIVRVSPKLLKYALAQQGLHEQLCRTRSERFSGLLEELRESREREITGRIRDFSGLPDSWRRRLLQLGDRPIIERDPGDRPLALEMRRRGLVGNAATEDDDSARATQQAVPLDSHCLGVAQLAEHFAEQLGLDPNLVEDVALAGYLHDAGKAHPAFRRLLYGGAELSAIGGPPLAKSARLPASPAARAEVRRRSGFPKDARHEVASLAFAEGHPKFVQAHDPEIVLWLIGTHHGYGRPFFPLVEWPRTGDEMIEADLGDGSVSVKPSRCLAELTAQWIDLFVSVQARYGPWGLARLEAILRLADHRQSEAEQMEVEDNEAEATSGTKGAAA